MAQPEIDLDGEGYALQRESAGWRALARDVVMVLSLIHI